MCSIIFFAITTGAQSENAAASDSLSYWHSREKIQSDSSISAILETADALANSGLYKEALEILGTLPSDNNNDIVERSGKKIDSRQRDHRWRLSAGTDYYHLEDVDTSEMTGPYPDTAFHLVKSRI